MAITDAQAERLLRLLSVQSKTYRTEAMIEHMHGELTAAGMTVTERAGQLFAHKGDLSKPVPFYVAHADTVHPIIPADHFEVNRWYNEKLNDHEWWAYDLHTKQQVGIGGDDKCGLFVCLEAALTLPDLGVIITIDEEAGCVGARMVRESDLEAAAVLIQADRRGGVDAIRTSAGTILSSEAWQEHVNETLTDHFYAWSDHGTITDVQEMVAGGKSPVSAINLAAGYYDAHTDAEFISEIDLMRAVGLCLELGRMSAGARWEHRDDWRERYQSRMRSRRATRWVDTGVDDRDKVINAAFRETDSFYGRDEPIPGGITAIWGGEEFHYDTIAEFEAGYNEYHGITNADQYCEYCEAYGHNWRDCPQMDPWEPYCAACNEYGHDYGDCPSPDGDDYEYMESEAEWIERLAKQAKASNRPEAIRVMGIPEATGEARKWEDDTKRGGEKKASKKKGKAKVTPLTDRVKEGRPTHSHATPNPAMQSKHRRILKNLTVAELLALEGTGEGETLAHCQAVGCEEGATSYDESLELSVCEEHRVMIATIRWLYGKDAIPNDVMAALEAQDVEQAREIAKQDNRPSQITGIVQKDGTILEVAVSC